MTGWRLWTVWAAHAAAIAVMDAVPVATAATRPALVTVATASFEVEYVTPELDAFDTLACTVTVSPT